jgi:ABC-type polysaccharide/polyol phosphate export permease
LRARYRGSALGFLWTFLNTVLLLLVYSLVFNVYLRLPMENYAVFVFTGLLLWIFFTQVLLEG